MSRDDMSIDFTGVDDMIARLRALEDKIQFAIKQVALFWAAKLESHAKEFAPWTDQTGNARQSLHTYVEEFGSELAKDSVKLYLSHGVDYGIYLEVKHAGQYGIIWPTIQRHLPAIQAMLDSIFK